MKVATKKDDLNQFIVDNHSDMSVKEMAKVKNINVQKIYYRLAKLKKGGSVNKGKISDIEFTQFIIDNHLTMSASEIAKATNRNVQNVYSKKCSLKKAGVFTYLDSKSDKKNDNLNELESAFKVSEQVVKRNVRAFGNPKGDKKQIARDKIINAIMNPQSPKGLIASLPFSTCELEQQLMEKAPNLYNFIGCEYDLDTFYDMVGTIVADPVLRKSITPYYGSIGDKLLQAEVNQYAHLILDYCGVLDTFKDEIKHIVVNDILPIGGTMSVTLSKMGLRNNMGVIGDMFDKVPTNFFDSELAQTELGVKMFFMNILKEGYVIEEFYNYQDHKKDGDNNVALDVNGNPKRCMSMMLIIIRRVK